MTNGGQQDVLRSRSQSHSSRGAAIGKEELGRRAIQFATVDFITQSICPLVANAALNPSERWKTAVVQNNGSGRLTLRYELGPETVLHAKLCTNDLGYRGYGALKACWDAGFNNGSRYRVPEPLAFLSDYNLAVVRQVCGKPIAAAFDEHSSVDLVEACREAARWLAALHRSSVRIGRPETDWESLKLFDVSSRVVEGAALRPEHFGLLRELLHSLRDCIRNLRERRPVVATHGDYHHDHVFLASETTSVIDLDKCCPADPAKDVARFVRVLRAAAFKCGFDMKRADKATKAFLQVYLGQFPAAEQSLGAFWATSIFYNLLGGLKRCRSGEKRTWPELMDFHVSEMKHAMEFGR